MIKWSLSVEHLIWKQEVSDHCHQGALEQVTTERDETAAACRLSAAGVCVRYKVKQTLGLIHTHPPGASRRTKQTTLTTKDSMHFILFFKVSALISIWHSTNWL